MARLTTTPPFAPRRGTRAPRAGGCPKFTATPPTSFPRTRETSEKQSISLPFAKRRGTRAQRAGGCPNFTATPHPTTTRLLSLSPTRRGGSRTAPTTPITEAPSPTTTVPSPASPSPSQGEIKRGSQGEGNRAAKGRGPHPNNHPLNHRNNPHPTAVPHPSIFPASSGVSQSTPIQNKALYQHIYGTSQLYFPLSLDSYRAVVLAFSLYKLVSDRRIWTPIKPRFDEGIKELR